MPDGFIESWDRLLRNTPGRQIEVGGRHPLQLMYGSDQEQRPLLFAISDLKPGLVELSDAVEVQRGERSLDGRWTLSLTLRDRRFINEFMRVGNELVEATRLGVNEAQALQFFVEGLIHWKGLFSHGPPEQLGRPAIRGLVGELWFGFDRLTEIFTPAAVLKAWTGPYKSPQDFNMTSGQAYEVKTVYPDTKSVPISSAEQLEVTNRPLELAVVTLTDVDESTPNAISLPSLVQRVDGMLGVADQSELRNLLREQRVDIVDTYYTDFWFRVDSCTTYRVNAEFPAIRRSSLNPVIDNVHYTIALYGIADYAITTWSAGALTPPASDTTTDNGPADQPGAAQ